MKVNRDVILACLREFEEKNGGYYGTDVKNLAEKLGVTWYSLKKMLTKWLQEDDAFKGLHYLGQHKPTITLAEFITIGVVPTLVPSIELYHIILTMQV